MPVHDKLSAGGDQGLQYIVHLLYCFYNSIINFFFFLDVFQNVF